MRTAGPGGISRLELAERTGLTPQAVSKITARLREDGLAAEAGHRASTGGKPRTVLRLVPDAGHAVGVHLDRDELRVVLADLDGRVVGERCVPLSLGAGAEAVLGAVVREVTAVAREAGEAIGGVVGDVVGGESRAAVVKGGSVSVAEGESGVAGVRGGSGVAGVRGGSGGVVPGGPGGVVPGGPGDVVPGGSGGVVRGGPEGVVPGGSEGVVPGGSGGAVPGGSEGVVPGGPGDVARGGSGGVVPGGAEGVGVASTAGREQRLALGTLLGVGVALPGPLDHAHGVLHRVTGFPEWDGFPLRDVLAARLGAPVVVDKDTNAAALGLAVGGERGSFACLHLGTGLGAGLVIGGTVHRGARTGAGEFGHQVIQLDGPPCTCGNRGCVEALCLAAIGRGDVAEAARVLGEAAANLAGLLDIDAVLLGGRTIAADPEPFVHGVAAVLDARARREGSPEGAVPVRLDPGGARGVAEGAAQLLLAPVFGRGDG
ncbi:ROK family transcriptional regulator [Streptomyces sp. B21-108]